MTSMISRFERLSMRFSLGLLVALAIGCASGGSRTDEVATHESAPDAAPAAAAPGSGPDRDIARVLTRPVRQIPGPKRTVAVQRFSSTGAFSQVYGDWDVGAGLGAMLVTALIESGQFIVVERANLGDILSEQELAATGMAGRGQDVEVGNLSSAQLMIYGAVTEFDTRDKSGAFNVGTSVGGGLVGLGRSKTEGSIGLDVRLVDASSGQVIKSERVKKAVVSKGFDISGGYKGVSIGDSQFSKTPIGKATREALTEVVNLILTEAERTEWAGQVVEFDGRNVYINAGSSYGIRAGDKFVIEKTVKKLTDPTTGEVLMVQTKKIGSVSVDNVAEKIAYGRFISTGGGRPSRGDRAVLPFQ